jgi:uncharacterized damage-inducible protein DinB
VLERLVGTPARLYGKISRFDSMDLIVSNGPKSSIKTEVGHLIDLEPLWVEQIDQIVAASPEITVADMTNKKANMGRRDIRRIYDLLFRFKLAREQTVLKFRSLEDEDLHKFSIHPGLKNPVRIIDLAYFIAEHDDHHLSQITRMMIQSGSCL